MPNYTTLRAESQPGPNPGPAYVHVCNVARDGLIYVGVEAYDADFDRFSDTEDIDDHVVDAGAWLTRPQVVDLIAALAAKLHYPVQTVQEAIKSV